MSSHLFFCFLENSAVKVQIVAAKPPGEQSELINEPPAERSEFDGTDGTDGRTGRTDGTEIKSVL